MKIYSNAHATLTFVFTIHFTATQMDSFMRGHMFWKRVHATERQVLMSGHY